MFEDGVRYHRIHRHTEDGNLQHHPRKTDPVTYPDPQAGRVGPTPPHEILRATRKRKARDSGDGPDERNEWHAWRRGGPHHGSNRWSTAESNGLDGHANETLSFARGQGWARRRGRGGCSRPSIQSHDTWEGTVSLVDQPMRRCGYHGRGHAQGPHKFEPHRKPGNISVKTCQEVHEGPAFTWSDERHFEAFTTLRPRTDRVRGTIHVPITAHVAPLATVDLDRHPLHGRHVPRFGTIASDRCR